MNSSPDEHAVNLPKQPLAKIRFSSTFTNVRTFWVFFITKRALKNAHPLCLVHLLLPAQTPSSAAASVFLVSPLYNVRTRSPTATSSITFSLALFSKTDEQCFCQTSPKQMEMFFTVQYHVFPMPTFSAETGKPHCCLSLHLSPLVIGIFQ